MVVCDYVTGIDFVWRSHVVEMSDHVDVTVPQFC